MRHQGRQESGYYRRRCNNHDVFGMFHPAQRIVTQQDVAHRTATNGGHGRNNDDTEQIHFAAPRRQRTRHGFSSNTNNVENGQ